MVERRINKRLSVKTDADADGATMLIRPPRIYSTHPTSIVHMTEADLLALLDVGAATLEELRLRRIA